MVSNKVKCKILFLLFGPCFLFLAVGAYGGEIVGALFGMILAFLWNMLMNKRISWVKREVQKMYMQEPEEICRLASFETIMARWWCWDLNEFKRPL